MLLSEDDEQKLLVQYLELKGYKFSALPLSTFTKSWAVKMKNKAMGVRAGVPDLMVIVKNKLIFIEMKKVKVGRLSPLQKEWIEALNECDRVKAFTCWGFDEAKKLIENL